MIDLFEQLPETFSDKDLKLKLTHFYLDWIHTTTFKCVDFNQGHVQVITNHKNEYLAKVGVAEIAVFYIKCKYILGENFYVIIDKTSKIWLYREFTQRVLVASIQDVDHLISLLNDPVLMED